MDSCTLNILEVWIGHCSSAPALSHAFGSLLLSNTKFKLLYTDQCIVGIKQEYRNPAPPFFGGKTLNIARGTTDPGYWVYNLNHFSDWNEFEIVEMNLKLFKPTEKNSFYRY